MTSEEKLQELVETLARVMNVRPPDKTTIQMQWFITQAKAYLNGEYETIDRALGLEEDTSK